MALGMTARFIFHVAGSETIELSGIIDQDRLSQGGIRRPSGEQIQNTAVINLEERRNFRVVSSGNRKSRVRPVASPKDAARVRRDKRLGHWRDVTVVRQLRTAIGRRNLDVDFSHFKQAQ